MKNEKIITIDIKVNQNLIVLLAIMLVAIGLVGFLIWNPQKAAASSVLSPLASSASMRQFYLTKTGSEADEALTMCASGYHMASLWEITDPSNLKYNTTLGYTTADSGQGPPTSYSGWIRTGYSSNSSSTAGQANCNIWTSNGPPDYGTKAYLPTNWTTGQDVHVWKVTTNFSCGDIGTRTWCVED